LAPDEQRVPWSVETWIQATTVGWFLGLLLLFGLILLWSPFGNDAQFMVGIGLGAGVGYMQSRLMRGWIRGAHRWTLASTLGQGSLFVVHDVARGVDVPFPYSAPLYVLVGAFLTGVWQASMLSAISPRARWWPVGSILGWALPAASILLDDSGKAGVVGDAVGLAAIFLGGAMVGAGSGGVLRWILGSASDVDGS